MLNETTGLLWITFSLRWKLGNALYAGQHMYQHPPHLPWSLVARGLGQKSQGQRGQHHQQGRLLQWVSHSKETLSQSGSVTTGINCHFPATQRWVEMLLSNCHTSTDDSKKVELYSRVASTTFRTSVFQVTDLQNSTSGFVTNLTPRMCSCLTQPPVSSATTRGQQWAVERPGCSRATRLCLDVTSQFTLARTRLKSWACAKWRSSELLTVSCTNDVKGHSSLLSSDCSTQYIVSMCVRSTHCGWPKWSRSPKSPFCQARDEVLRIHWQVAAHANGICPLFHMKITGKISGGDGEMFVKYSGPGQNFEVVGEGRFTSECTMKCAANPDCAAVADRPLGGCSLLKKFYSSVLDPSVLPLQEFYEKQWLAR